MVSPPGILIKNIDGVDTSSFLFSLLSLLWLFDDKSSNSNLPFRLMTLLDMIPFSG